MGLYIPTTLKALWLLAESARSLPSADLKGFVRDIHDAGSKHPLHSRARRYLQQLADFESGARSKMPVVPSEIGSAFTARVTKQRTERREKARAEAKRSVEGARARVADISDEHKSAA
jgi:hypothetical protein